LSAFERPCHATGFSSPVQVIFTPVKLPTGSPLEMCNKIAARDRFKFN
jgi:hypothetical protein